MFKFCWAWTASVKAVKAMRMKVTGAGTVAAATTIGKREKRKLQDGNVSLIGQTQTMMTTMHIEASQNLRGNARERKRNKEKQCEK